MKRAIIDIICDENALLSRSMGPEVVRSIPRTEVSITEEEEEVLQIRIDAMDINALRGALNSYLRWVSVGMETVALTSDHERGSKETEDVS